MPNILVVYDDVDPSIGLNLSKCYNHLKNNINLANHTIASFDGANCDCLSIQDTITTLQQAPFIFIAYSHGGNDCLSSHTHGEYVNTANSYYFGEALFYTNACYTAQSLRQALIGENCRVYIGYEDEVRVPNDDILEALFIECENHAITLFLNDDKSIGDCFKEMQDKYVENADSLIAQGNIFLAAQLLQNRDQLVIDGDTSTTRLCYV